MDAEGVLLSVQDHSDSMQNCEEARVRCDDDTQMVVTRSPKRVTALP